MPCGSRASLIRRVRSITSGPSWSGSQRLLEPADAVLAGDRAAQRDRERPSPRRTPLCARSVSSGSAGSKTISGWVLPSPACAIDRDGRRRAARRSRAIAVDQRGERGIGTPTSSSSRVPSALDAGIAMRRAATNASPSSGSSVANTSVAPCLCAGLRHRPRSPPRRPRPARRTARSASRAASRSRPIGTQSSTALIAGAVHQLEHRRPQRRGDREDGVGRVLERGERRDHRRAGGGCAGSSRSVDLGDDAERALRPTNSLVSDSPATSLRRGPPRRTAVPSASTTSMPST